MNLKELSYKRKNQLLILSMVIVLFVAWNLAFKKTFEAYKLNNSLNNKSHTAQNLSYNASYMSEKAILLDSIVERYEVDSASWKNSFWMNVSRSVLSPEIKIIYQPEDKVKEELAISSIERQYIVFDADYKRLIVLLDSLKGKNEAGYITSVSFTTNKKKRTNDIESVRMKVVFSVIKEIKQ
jgi:hypothetical protein